MSTRTHPIKRSQVEELIGRARVRSNVFYLVKWVGIPFELASWEKSNLFNYNTIQTVRKQFNTTIQDKPLPYIIEKYSHLTDQFLSALHNCTNQVPPSKVPQAIWGKERRGPHMYYLVQFKNQPIYSSIWVPRYILEQGALLRKFISQTRWQQIPFAHEKYLKSIGHSENHQKRIKKEQLQIKKEYKNQNEFIKKDHFEQNDEKQGDYFEQQTGYLNKQEEITQLQKDLSNEELNQKNQKAIKNEKQRANNLSLTQFNQNLKTIKEYKDSFQTKIIGPQKKQEKKNLEERESNKKSENLCDKNPKKQIKKIAFLGMIDSRDQSKETSFLVTFGNGEQREMIACELRQEHPKKYIRYLEILCQKYGCFD